MTTRPVLTVALTISVLLAGCTGTLATFSANPATISTEAHDSAGYAHLNTTMVPVRYPVGFGPITRDVVVNMWVSGYAKGVPEGESSTPEGAESGETDETVPTLGNDTAVVVLLTTPDEEVEGQSVNPFSQVSDRGVLVQALDLLVEAQTVSGIGNVSGLQKISTTEREILGTPTEIVTFDGVVETAEGERTSVRMHVAIVRHGGDVVVAIGAHDSSLDEADAIAQLFERIEHEVKAETGEE